MGTTTLSIILLILQVLLALGNFSIMIFGLYKFMSSPRINLENRVSVLETKLNDIETSLLKGNDKFRDQDDAIKVVLKSVIALIEFEIQYCLTENKQPSDELKKAKTDLNEFLSKR